MKITKDILFILLSVVIASCGKDKPIVTPEVTPITITEFYPQKMITGRELTIVGTNFDPVAANNLVKINGVVAIVNYASATAINVTIPAAATSGKVTVKKGTVSSISSTDFTVINNPYQNVRLKEVYYGASKLRSLFFYDSENKLTSIKNYAIDAFGLEYLESTATYSYGPNKKIDNKVFEEIIPLTKISYVTNYTYVNEMLSTVTLSKLDATTTPAVKTVTKITKYDYLKGILNSVAYFNPITNTANGFYRYDYSILDGNPKIVSFFSNDASSPILGEPTTTIEYANVLSPIYLFLPAQTSILLEKSQLFGGVIGAYTFTYTLDTTEKIASITTTHPLFGSYTDTYTYENKN
jgi:hypothetical protein